MSNQAAYAAQKGAAFKVDSAPYPKPGPGQVVVKSGAVAINPVDHKMRDIGMFVQKWPTVLGCDLAGEIVEVGEGVTTRSKGQRVLGLSMSLVTGNNAEATFQNYTVVLALMTATIPDSMSYADASVLPLALSTATTALYMSKWLGLPLPTNLPKPTGQTLLIWGGASSVGACAIQLAKGSGFDVVSTSSKRNFDFVKSMGASKVFDYSSSSVVEDIVAELKNTKLAGVFDAAGASGVQCATVLKEVQGKGMFPSVQRPPPNLPEGIETGQVFGTDPALVEPRIGQAVFHDFLPQALHDGTFVSAPKASIVGHGLDKLQEACNKLKAGVSATKLVVTL